MHPASETAPESRGRTPSACNPRCALVKGLAARRGDGLDALRVTWAERLAASTLFERTTELMLLCGCCRSELVATGGRVQAGFVR